MHDAEALRALLDRLEGARVEITSRYEERLKRHVRAYAALPSSHLTETAIFLINLFVRLVRAREAARGGGLDMALLVELDAVSRARARQGIGVGDLHGAIMALVATSREVTFEHTPDRELRAASHAWVEVEMTVALIISWMLDEHGRRVADGSDRIDL